MIYRGSTDEKFFRGYPHPYLYNSRTPVFIDFGKGVNSNEKLEKLHAVFAGEREREMKKCFRFYFFLVFGTFVSNGTGKSGILSPAAITAMEESDDLHYGGHTRRCQAVF